MHSIYSVGTQVVVRQVVRKSNGSVAYPEGSVGVVAKCPADREHAYRVRFPDGFEASMRHQALTLLAEFKQGDIGRWDAVDAQSLFERVIYRCVVGSRAYGLDGPDSDTDRRGIFLPPAERDWSIYGVPEQLENDDTQEAYWELKKLFVLALKGNPNVLECLYSPLVESVTPLGQEILDARQMFLSKLVYQTYNGYVLSQFKKMQRDKRNQGRIRWKHVMHLIRLLLSGITVLREGYVPLRVDEYRDTLLEIKAGKRPWREINEWRLALHHDLDEAFKVTELPERPDYDRANRLLIDARRRAQHEELP